MIPDTDVMNVKINQGLEAKDKAEMEAKMKVRKSEEPGRLGTETEERVARQPGPGGLLPPP